MSYLVAAALKKHKTPEEFVERFLVPAMRRGDLRGTHLTRPLKRPITVKLKDFATGKWRHFRTLMFYDKTSPKRGIVINLERTHRSSEYKHSTQTTPMLRINGTPALVVAERDWNALASFSKTVNHAHSQVHRSSASEILHFPEHLIAHWNYQVFTDSRGDEVARIGLDTNVFNKLFQRYRPIDVVGSYITTLSFLAGRLDAAHYEAMLSFRRKVPALGSASSIDKFSGAYGDHSSLFLELASLVSERQPTLDKMKETLNKHFGSSGRYTGVLARKLYKVFSHSGTRQAAVDLSRYFEESN